MVLFTAGLEDYAAPICNALDNNYRCGCFRLPNCFVLQAGSNVIFEVKQFNANLSSVAKTPVGVTES